MVVFGSDIILVIKEQDKNQSFLFNHVRGYNHCIDWSNANSVIHYNSFTVRNIIEFSIVEYTQNCNVNISESLYKLDSFVVDKICNQFPFLSS